MKIPFLLIIRYGLYISIFSFLLVGDSCKIISNPTSIVPEKNIPVESIFFDTIVKDIDGNSYPVIQIGNQLWMTSNLRVSRYKTGKPISQKQGNSINGNIEEEGRFVWYQNNEDNELTYGKLYNYYVIMGGCLCPEGWHVPAVEEWQQMIDYLGVTDNAGIILQADTGINFYNELGGIMIPENILSPFSDINKAGYWWTNTSVGRNTVADYELHLGKLQVIRGSVSEGAFLSVRCIKNISK
ncbi:MAG: fibrobacter succinogenes major paralogous domain-containing protein [Bacteroidetes bacterium]|nr:fibrobacter succinogenes major paralogous domain-containing protein [Bacteroidota bacterium]